jgi:type II secretory pathway pseudopilin PulG
VRSQRGFTYLGVLLAIALLGIGIVAVSEAWTTTAKRQRMQQLEWVGQQYVQAIGSYYESSPGNAKSFPKSLEDLLEDRRVPFVRRHLRQLYVNPLSGKLDWELIEVPGLGIRGIRAKEGAQDSDRQPPRNYVYLTSAVPRPVP